MLTKTLVTTLIALATTTTAALAAPCEQPTAAPRPTVTTQVIPAGYAQPVYQQPVYQQPVYAQPIYQPVVYQPPTRPTRPPVFGHGPVVRPVMITASTGIGTGGRQFIHVGAQDGAFRELKLRADRGVTQVSQVYVQFANGHEQEVRNVNRTLAGDATLSIDLDGNRPEAIQRIVVYGAQRSRAATFSVVGV